ncbi:putative alpha-ketoglutarate-dependent sulfonate dioxygenase [Xylariaceae sp. FL1272]|nr:putative alpha-ketoglutarate-dependent sulfonate dioxygenase [Xylariaceae sp. FL1272]
MSPSAVEEPVSNGATKGLKTHHGDTSKRTTEGVSNVGFERQFGDFTIPDLAMARMKKAGIDMSKGYPEYPPANITLEDVQNLQPEPIDFVDRGSKADKEKKALFGAAKHVKHLSYHCGTEIIGLQLKDLNETQLDELALLVAERGVVFFRDQDLSPQQQRDVTGHFGPIFPQNAHVPGVPEVSVIWAEYFAKGVRKPTFRTPFQGWHTDLVHLPQTFGITHLHYDTVPEFGGDLLWSSGAAAYCKLSHAFRKFLDGKMAVMRSGDPYIDPKDPGAGPKYREEIHPIVRVHPATGWKVLFVNRPWVLRIIGLEKVESDMVLKYLADVYEHSIDIQCRFNWTPGTSAIWDNRCTLHNASWDYENRVQRHGTRVATIAEKPYFDESAVSMRVALGLEDD